MALYNGTSGVDTLNGSADADTINGGANNDTLYGNGGNDTVDGGSGNDLIFGDDSIVPAPVLGSNIVVNGSFEQGSDAQGPGTFGNYPSLPGWTLQSGGAIEVLYNYSDAAFAPPAQDGVKFLELDGTAFPMNTTIYQDVATGGTDQFLLEFYYSARGSHEGTDSQMNVYWDGALLGNITQPAAGWNYYSFLVNGAGATTRLTFEGVGDQNFFGALLDNVSVKAVDDIASDDSLIGGSGNDTIYGGYGNDTISDISGNNLLFGQDGNDTITANSGNDTIDGGLGADQLTSGSGKDLFVFTSTDDSTTTAFDTITDFNKTVDKIDLSGLGFTGIQLGAAAGSILGYAHVGTQTIITDTSDFKIALDGIYVMNNGMFDFV